MVYWFLTNTTYGTWLPGDARGSVTSVRDRRSGESPTPTRREHDRFGEAYEGFLPGLLRSAQSLMKGPPIYLQKEQAAAVLEQFRATATYRGWALLAVSIMTNHWHLVVGVPEGYAAERVLADFKAYASRVLNRQYGRPPSGTWWTTKGSTRRLNDQQAVDQTIHYVLHRQNKPLVVWSAFADRLQRELES